MYDKNYPWLSMIRNRDYLEEMDLLAILVNRNRVLYKFSSSYFSIKSPVDSTLLHKYIGPTNPASFDLLLTLKTFMYLTQCIGFHK